MVHIVQDLHGGVRFGQQGAAEGVKSAEPDIFAAFAHGAHHAVLHHRRGLVGEGQPQQALAGERRVGLQQVADALGDDARLACARARHHQQRTFAVAHCGALLRVQQVVRVGRARYFQEFRHVLTS